MYPRIRQMLAVLALALPSIASAQGQPLDPGSTSQDNPAQALPMPYSPRSFPMPPWMPGPGFDPFMPPSQHPADSATRGVEQRPLPLPWSEPGAPVSLRIRRQVTPDAYLLRVTPGDGKTADIQITPRDRTLEIGRVSGAQTTEERSFDDGRGYMSSYRYSSSSTSRRIRVPPDADMAAMTREESDGTILIRIPRQSSRGRSEKR
jgi:hypothetical protein